MWQGCPTQQLLVLLQLTNEPEATLPHCHSGSDFPAQPTLTFAAGLDFLT